LQKVKNTDARIFYLQSTVKNRYSRAVLLHQIEADAYGNYQLHPSQHNFATALPLHLQEQTRESIKSVYSLDFLDINKPMTERQLENTMVEKVKRLLMELGYGFCFIGNQHPLTLGEKEYFIDLLFYHRVLKCLIAVELKVTEFEPEFVGKLDFYLQLIDEQLKMADDKPSIGILLVPHKDKLEVEYALRTASKPIGVAQYKLSKQLPEELLGKLPSADDFSKILVDRKEADDE
jgi:predicted nuclease of restriction endonuclease-like (RecB) superfamily